MAFDVPTLRNLRIYGYFTAFQIRNSAVLFAISASWLFKGLGAGISGNYGTVCCAEMPVFKANARLGIRSFEPGAGGSSPGCEVARARPTVAGRDWLLSICSWFDMGVLSVAKCAS